MERGILRGRPVPWDLRSFPSGNSMNGEGRYVIRKKLFFIGGIRDKFYI